MVELIIGILNPALMEMMFMFVLNIMQKKVLLKN
jgi:hypothetical protein